MMKRFWLVPLMLLSGGCLVTLEGTGELGVGVRNDNMLVLYHKADPSAEFPVGKSAAELEADSFVEYLIDLGWTQPDVPSAE